MLTFDHVTFSYPDEPTPAVADISLSVDAGRRIMLLGANGSGKSTIARLANGMLLPDAGSVSADGITSAGGDVRALRTRVGVVSQDPESQIVAGNVADEVAFGPENLGLPREEIARRVDEALAATGLAGFKDREPHMLSGGEKQRLVIAGILAMEPGYLVLDEPGSMLDARARRDIRRLVRKLCAEGCGILHITHDIAECEGADGVVVLDGGRIAFSGTLPELLGDGDLLATCGLRPTPMMRLVTRLAEAGLEISTDSMAPSIVAHEVAQAVSGKRGGAR